MRNKNKMNWDWLTSRCANLSQSPSFRPSFSCFQFLITLQYECRGFFLRSREKRSFQAWSFLSPFFFLFPFLLSLNSTGFEIEENSLDQSRMEKEKRKRGRRSSSSSKSSNSSSSSSNNSSSNSKTEMTAAEDYYCCGASCFDFLPCWLWRSERPDRSSWVSVDDVSWEKKELWLDFEQRFRQLRHATKESGSYLLRRFVYAPCSRRIKMKA